MSVSPVNVEREQSGPKHIHARLFAMAVAFGLGASAGCFNGEDALGLPCNSDEDCGQGQACEAGFCGGSPEADCGNGIVESPEECDEGEANGEGGSCTAECTINVCGDGVLGPDEACDDGNDVSGDGCSASCELESCGDGKVDEGEECDEGEANDDNGSCTTACTEAVCGDGFVQEGEDCDDSGESATCNDDCSPAACGDAKLNVSAGEVCEPEGGQSGPECMSNCLPPILWEDVEGDTSAWTFDEVVNGGLASGWGVTVDESNSGQRSFHTGDPVDGPASWRLVSPSLDLSEVAVGDAVTVEIQHWYDFDDCGSQDQESDGAFVEVISSDMSVSLLEPVGGYVETIDNQSGCGAGSENPYVDAPAFSHTNGGFALETFDLSDFAGESVQLAFHVAWDCGECNDGANNGWYVDDVIVYRGEL